MFNINPVVTTFLGLLARANTVAIHSTTDVSWTLDKPSGNPDNELVQFHWDGPDGSFAVALTEGAIAEGKWVGSSFFCNDVDGDETQISFYEHVALVPTERVTEQISTLRCPGSIEGGLLTLEDGRTIDLEKIAKSLGFIASSPMPDSNDEEHDLLVDVQASAADALTELTRVCA